MLFVTGEVFVDISVIFKIAALGIVTAIAAMLLKRSGREEIATVVSVVGLAIALALMMDTIAQLYQTLQSLFEQ